MTQSPPSEQQKEVNQILHQSRMNAFFWVFGINSIRAILGARKAKNLIQKSGGTLTGEDQVRFSELIGWIGVLVWIPLILVGIIVSMISK